MRERERDEFRALGFWAEGSGFKFTVVTDAGGSTSKARDFGNAHATLGA